ncbi:MAG: hypothetical protein JOZ37_00725 [Actinobacteria bacterium]|nr:hypothetical protein [Actinomycetota bacterium]MBV9932956.1 hypothetical protein [Actinomycetota bacterium]
MGGGRVGALLAGAVLMVATGCGGKGGGEKIIPLASTPTTVATTGAPGSTVPRLSDRDVAQHFEGLLERNNGARAQVTSSVQTVSSCSGDPIQEHNALGGVINGRRQLVDELNNLDVSALPEGGNLKSNLVQAWQASIAADIHFQDWMTAVSERGCTRNGVNSGPEWDAANASSIQATQFKQNFSSVWSQVAPRYGLRTWAENEL